MPFLGGTVREGQATAILTPTRECILSWNAPKRIDIDVRVCLASGHLSNWLPYVRTYPWRSCSSVEGGIRLEVDTVVSEELIVACEVRAPGAEAIFCSSPGLRAASPLTRFLTHVPLPVQLNIPTKTQYIGGQRGWCSPASLSMILGYWAQREMRLEWDLDVTRVAREVFDTEYAGTGNWTFAAAYAASLGLRGVVVYLRDLDQVHGIVSAGIPLALAIAWEEGELPGAPLPRSDGHVLTVRGFDQFGNVLVNDPALPEIAATYPRVQFETIWLRAGEMLILLPR